VRSLRPSSAYFPGQPVKESVEGDRLLIVDSRTHATKFDELDLKTFEKIAPLATLALERAESALAHQAEELARRSFEPGACSDIIGVSPSAQSLRNFAARAGTHRANVLILGESGTGKEVFARALHGASPRHAREMIAESLASVPEELAISVLFGHKKGAFTGATEDTPGLFRLAHKSTFFLDEIGEASPSLQAMLLRAIESREVRRVGEDAPTKVDVRLIVATNRDLYAMVKAGTFREDLLYRLDVIKIRIPPLRERPEDIPVLADHFRLLIARENKREPLRFAKSAWDALKNHDWPGNVRELKNAIERAYVWADREIRGEDILPDRTPALLKSGTLDAKTDEAFLSALEDCHHDTEQAAKLLGRSRSWAYVKKKELEERGLLPRARSGARR